MLVIRLARTGKKHQAYFRIVVADKRSAVGSKFIEIVGNYNPHEKNISLDKEKILGYLKNGAQPSNTVAKLLKAEKIDLPGWVKIEEKNRAPKKAPVEPEKATPTEVKAEAEDTETAEVAVEAEEKQEEKAEEVKEEVATTEEAPATEEEKPAEEVKETEADK